ncbi:iron-containing alcohol dehydrogenase [Desulfosporosinus sp. BICA1-9]|uniref:iron-containing alcohol dehydrogenase n=1 Tax=Desulfosporosinus sp. BICA1-9 TaxID=1531958 RepID=UPI00054BDFBE|nr:iron-containing alcohol dehydrogenase [Desulfosporosinus sp. BICA1-9]KJS46968.1 MAG: alcohol dehydrogenase [Peptococcaceae bacterium BRH_c23]KJS87641.1 MAG: alcohol dehydrogenase [Desulfosporosinus sp. BICA1-9]HBW33842.1 L-threonine dehydrogenase [Desulfosporosinus sp.]
MQKPTYFYMPSINLMGTGCLNNFGQELHAKGYKKALIVTDKNLVNLGHVGKVELILKDAGITYSIFDGVEHPNPTISFVENGLDHLKKGNLLRKDFDFIISVGGGTNHDCARSIALLAANGGKIADYEGLSKVPKAILPWVAINTTSGSGAEVTIFDIISDESRKVKMDIVDPQMLATLTVNDPSLMTTMPREVTISSGIDVLAHAIEAYVSFKATPVTDALALGAIKLVFNYLRKAAANGNDTEAREKMMYAEFMAGMSFNNAGVGYIHAIAHQIGGFSNRHHGLITGALIPYVLKFNAPAVPVERFMDIAIAMGEEDITEDDAVETVLAAINELNAELGIPSDLSELGAKEENVGLMAENASKDVAGLTNPRQATLEDMIQLIRTSMEMESGQKPKWELDEQFLNPIDAMLANNAERLSANDSHINRT